MNSPLPLRVVSSAARAIAEAADWWSANRPKAPDAFVTDLEKALQSVSKTCVQIVAGSSVKSGSRNRKKCEDM